MFCWKNPNNIKKADLGLARFQAEALIKCIISTGVCLRELESLFCRPTCNMWDFFLFLFQTHWRWSVIIRLGIIFLLAAFVDFESTSNLSVFMNFKPLSCSAHLHQHLWEPEGVPLGWFLVTTFILISTVNTQRTQEGGKNASLEPGFGFCGDREFLQSWTCQPETRRGTTSSNQLAKNSFFNFPPWSQKQH